MIYRSGDVTRRVLQAGYNLTQQTANDAARAMTLRPSSSPSGEIYQQQQYPVVVQKLDSWTDVGDNYYGWQFPIDPIVAVSGRNIITKRNVCKTQQQNWRGSVKELWSQDDYTVSIAGVFLGETADDDLARLKDMLNHQGILGIYCSVFEKLDIRSLVIESFDIKEPIQGRYDWTLKLMSDDAYELLVEEGGYV